MLFGAYLRRERIASTRRGTAFYERSRHLIQMAATVAVCVVVWDWRGWDRSSVAGSASFVRSTFGLIVSVEVGCLLFLVPAFVAPTIAAERDRKSLDALLATPASAAQIVAGALGVGLLRLADGWIALVPAVILMASFGGVDPRLILLAGVGLASTAFALAAIAVAVSASVRTATRATSLTISLAIAWVSFPTIAVLLLPRVWPAAAPWVAPVALPLLDSSPVGPWLSLLRVVSRGSLVDTVPRMIAIQAVAAATLVLWTIARLRPASRAVYDLDGRDRRRAMLARWRRRPACGDDPVLWREMYPARTTGPVMWAVGWMMNATWLGLFAYATSWFVIPAFAELIRNGYGPTPGHPSLPELNPFARVLVGKLSGATLGPAPGQARLEFNILLRQVACFFDALFILMVAGFAAESVVAERERETWLGLIGTPLTGREILGGKLLGSIWKARGLAYLMLVLWTVGLLAGAVHPLGYLAALVGTAASCWFFAAVGVSASLRSRDRGAATSWVVGPLIVMLGLGALPFLVPGTASVLLATGSMPYQAWASLLSYDDVHAALHSRVPPQLAAIGIRDVAWTRIIMAAWLTITAAQAAGASLLTRAAVRGFDAAIGRPTRPRADVRHG
jgi:ABC-type transport system involved in multi-copper enzyme maturation permease subunit